MNITTSVGIAAVLAFTISCASTKAGPMEAQPQASSAPAPAAAGVSDREAVFATYAGEYDINGAVTTIRARGDVLVREMAGQPPQELRPIGKSTTRFKVGTSQMELEFRPDQSGRVTLIMRAGRHEARGVRRARGN